MTWNEIDARLDALGLDRNWLATATHYSAASIREALAPNSRKRSDRMLAVLSRVIEDEEASRRPAGEPREIAPGIFDIFQTEEQLDRADRASRLVDAPSLADYCRDVILAESDRLLAEERRRGLYVTPFEGEGDADGLRVAEGDGQKEDDFPCEPND